MTSTLPPRPRRLRPQPAYADWRAGAPASRYSSSSTTRAVARTACSTATPAASSSCPSCSTLASYPTATCRWKASTVRLAGRRVAHPAQFERRGLPPDGVRRCRGAGAPSGRSAAFVRRTRPRDCLPRLALDPLPERRRGHRARAHAHRHGDHRAPDRHAPLGWYTGRDSPNTWRLVASTTAASCTTPDYGDDPPFWDRGDEDQTADQSRIWWCPTRSTPTACASALPQGFRTATSSSTTCATPSTMYAEGESVRR